MLLIHCDEGEVEHFESWPLGFYVPSVGSNLTLEWQVFEQDGSASTVKLVAYVKEVHVNFNLMRGKLDCTVNIANSYQKYIAFTPMPAVTTVTLST